MLFLLLACHPIDTTRGHARGHGMVLDVVSREDPDQVHLRRFEVDVEPRASLSVRCDGGGDTHREELGTGTHREGSIVGLLADTRYDCVASATRDGETLEAEVGFETDRPVVGVPEIEVEGEGFGAFTLFNTWRTGQGGAEQVLLIADDQGRARWAVPLGDRTQIGIEATPWDDRSLLIGGGGDLAPQQLTLGGDVLFSFPPADQFWHHDTIRTPHGTVFGMETERVVGAAGGGWTGFRILEVDPATGEPGFTWSSQDAFDAGILPRGTTDDPWHANGLVWVDDDLGPGLLVSLPGLDRIVRLDPITGEVVWQLGRGLDFTLWGGEWFSGQHAPAWQDGRLLLHDNGIDRAQTRALELSIDQEAMRAEVVWQWTKPDWYEPIWGEADWLPDGTVLVTHGHCGFCPGIGSGPSSIAIVDPATGAIDWQLTLPDPDLGLYRAERLERGALGLD